MAPVSGTVWMSESATSPGPGRKIDDEVVELSPNHGS